jgi:prepilin-type N-terminal cleavage/methylation domain-containing protein
VVFVFIKNAIIYGMKIRKNKAFTLVELLIVIAIIAIIAGVILGSMSEARAKGRDASKIRSMGEIQKALTLYYSQNGGYPQSSNVVNGMQALVTAGLIPSFPSNIRYLGTGTSVGGMCSGYQLAATLEKDNIVLDTDADIVSIGAGEVTRCLGTSLGLNGELTAGSGNDAVKCRNTDTGSYCYDVAQ